MTNDGFAGAEEFAQARLGPLRRFAYLICGSVAEADDLAQIAVIEVWRRWRTAGEDPEAYARRVIVTRNVSRWRRWRREILVGTHQSPTDDPASGELTDPELWQALRALRMMERTVVVLHVLYGHTFDEIAAVVGEPRGTVSSRYSRAVRRLREHLRAARYPEPGLAWLPGGCPVNEAGGAL